MFWFYDADRITHRQTDIITHRGGGLLYCHWREYILNKLCIYMYSLAKVARFRCLVSLTCICPSVCVDSTKGSSRRAVTSWSRPRHRRRHPGTAAAAAGCDIIDDDDMDDNSLPYFSLPLDIKPYHHWLHTTVCSCHSLVYSAQKFWKFCARFPLILRTIFASYAHCFRRLTVPYCGLYTVKMGAHLHIF